MTATERDTGEAFLKEAMPYVPRSQVLFEYHERHYSVYPRVVRRNVFILRDILLNLYYAQVTFLSMPML